RSGARTRARRLQLDYRQREPAGRLLMARFGFPGGSYTLQSVNANCQKTQNSIPEADESGFGVSAMHLNPTPGLALFAALPHGMVRAVFEFKGVLYAVADSGFYVVKQDGTFTQAGVVAT